MRKKENGVQDPLSLTEEGGKLTHLSRHPPGGGGDGRAPPPQKTPGAGGELPATAAYSATPTRAPEGRRDRGRQSRAGRSFPRGGLQEK